MITNITEERIAELRRQIATIDHLVAMRGDPQGTYRALLESTRRDLAAFEQRRAAASPKA